MEQLRNLVSVTEPADRNQQAMLQSRECSAMALKPGGFESPVKLEE